MQTPIPKDAREFGQACDTLIRFVHKYEGLLNEEELKVVVAFVRSMAFEISVLTIDPGSRVSNRFRRMDH